MRPNHPLEMLASEADEEPLAACASLLRALAAQLREAVVDYQAFETCLRPCELSNCRATCCHDGVVLDPEEATMIGELLQDGKLHAYGMPASAEWRTTPDGERPRTLTRLADAHALADDFPAHFTRTRCVFLDAEHRCVLQRLAIDEGRHAWFYKPVGCWMHPIALLVPEDARGRPLLTLRTPANSAGPMTDFATCTHCGRPDREGVPASEALSGEIAFLSRISGRDFGRELLAPAVPGNPSPASASFKPEGPAPLRR